MKPSIKSTTAVLALLSAASCSEPTAPHPTLDPSPAVLPVLGHVAAATGYVAVDLGTLGGVTSSALEVNDAGQVVGTSTTSSGERHAFLWENGIMTDLGTLGGTSSGLAGVLPSRSLSEAGHVIGRSTIAGDAETHAYIWQDGVMTDLGGLGGSGPRPIDVRAVNASGQVVGGSLIPGNAEQHVFLWENGVMHDLGNLGGTIGIATALNEAGQIAGRSTLPNGEFRIFLWDDGVMNDIGSLAPGLVPNFAVAYGINEAGQVIGRTSTPAGPGEQNAFLWANGAMTDLGNLGGSGARASQSYEVTESGDVVGFSWTAGNAEQHAVLWENGVLNDLGVPLGGSRASARSINESGQIAGWSLNVGDLDAGAVLWEEGVALDLGTLGGAGGTATDINESGWIVGTSTDGAGESHATLWRPQTPVELAENLADLIATLGAVGTLSSGQVSSLEAVLDQAIAKIEDGRDRVAANQLGAFINEVEALIRSGRLAPEDGQLLIGAATGIIDLLGG